MSFEIFKVLFPLNSIRKISTMRSIKLKKNFFTLKLDGSVTKGNMNQLHRYFFKKSPKKITPRKLIVKWATQVKSSLISLSTRFNQYFTYHNREFL